MLNHYAARVQLDDNGLQTAKQTWKVLHDVRINELYDDQSLLLVSTELNKRQNNNTSNREREKYWMNEYSIFQQTIQCLLMENMNTHDIIINMQSLLHRMSKEVLDGSVNLPISIMKSIVEYCEDFLKDAGFVGVQTKEMDLQQQGLLDTFCTFRQTIRNDCLESLKDEEKKKELNKKLLNECDLIRSTVSTSYKITMIDGKDGILWIPGEIPQKKTSDNKKKKQGLVASLPPSEMFKQSGEYSTFDENGFPILYKNGKPVSPTKLKKLHKQYETHKAIHEKWLASQKKKQDLEIESVNEIVVVCLKDVRRGEYVYKEIKTRNRNMFK